MKEKFLYFLSILVMYTILDGLYYLFISNTQPILWFFLVLGIGLTIDFSMKHFTGKDYWCIGDVIDKLRNK